MFDPAYYQRKLDSLPKVAVAADHYRVIHSASAFRTRLLELIHTASRRIFITALYLESDSAGEQVLRALFEARQARPELDIRVFVDFHRARRGRMGEAAPQTPRSLYQQLLQEYALPVSVYGVPVKAKEIFGVLHLKGFVFDDTLVYSGASISNAYLHQGDHYRADRYHEIKSGALSDSFVSFSAHYFNHQAVRSLVEESGSGWELRGRIRQLRRRLQAADYSFEAVVGAGIQLMPVCGLGPRGNKLNRLVRDLVNAAERHLFICTPYFNLPRSLARDIRQFMRRGGHVTLVTGDKTASDFYSPPEQPFSRASCLPYLYESYLRDFAQRHQKQISAGQLELRLWKDPGNSYHVKGIYADGVRGLVTGSNLNPRAWRMDFENGLLFVDPDRLLESEFEQEQQQVLARTRRVEDYSQLQKVDDYPPRVQSFLRRIRRLRAHVLLSRLI